MQYVEAMNVFLSRMSVVDVFFPLFVVAIDLSFSFVKYSQPSF